MKKLYVRDGTPVASRPGEVDWTMLGWMILFALMTLPGAAATIAGYHTGASLKTTTIVFAGLFMAALFTRMVRGIR
ncbi:MAG TPA: hypothetical protein VK724_07420 [Bryobacteraceae bacterium]|nr:hypothetical protein [Bryobacteraceae bacterium]